MATSRRSTTSDSAASSTIGADGSWTTISAVDLHVGLVARQRSEVRNGGEQALRVRVLGCLEHLVGGAGLDDQAALHHDHPVGKVGDDAHVVGDQDDAGVDAVAQVAHQLEDLRLHRDVERRRRLVGDEQRRVARQRLGDHRPLPLATGQLMRVDVDAPLGVGDLDQREQLDRPLPSRLGSHRVVAAQHLGDLEADGVDGVERRHRLLEDHRRLSAADLAQRVAVDADDLLAAQLDRAAHRGVLRQQPEHRHRRRRLARSGLADDGQHLAGEQVELGADDGRVPHPVDPEVDVEVADGEDRVRPRGRRSSTDILWTRAT